MSRKLPLPVECMWSGCPLKGVELDTPDHLVQHVNTNHVEVFSGQDIVLCMWEGCKVYNVASSSYQWLRKHVQQVHTKERPHKCIMNGCNMSFQTVDALQRHLQRHFQMEASSGGSPKSVELVVKSSQFQPVVKATKVTTTAKLPPPLVHVAMDEPLPLPPLPKRPCTDLSESSEVSTSESGGESRNAPLQRKGESSLPKDIVVK